MTSLIKAMIDRMFMSGPEESGSTQVVIIRHYRGRGKHFYE